MSEQGFDMKQFQKHLKDCLDAYTLEQKVKADTEIVDFISFAIREARREALERVRPNKDKIVISDSGFKIWNETINAELERWGKEKP